VNEGLSARVKPMPRSVQCRSVAVMPPTSPRGGPDTEAGVRFFVKPRSIEGSHRPVLCLFVCARMAVFTDIGRRRVRHSSWERGCDEFFRSGSYLYSM